MIDGFAILSEGGNAYSICTYIRIRISDRDMRQDTYMISDINCGDMDNLEYLLSCKYYLNKLKKISEQERSKRKLRDTYYVLPFSVSPLIHIASVLLFVTLLTIYLSVYQSDPNLKNRSSINRMLLSISLYNRTMRWF